MSTDDITVRFAGGERVFSPGAAVTIGRDPDCELVLENPRVSRRHGELAHSSRGWVYRDLGSSRGTFAGSTPVTEQVLDRSMTLNLGGPSDGDGDSLDVIVSPRTSFAPPPPTTSGPVGATPSGPPTSPAPGAPGPDRPGGSLREEPVGATVVTGQSINVQCAGRSYTFPPGKEIVIGRDPSSDVPVDNPVVSRRHAAIRSTGSGWELVDYGSSSGTFLDGERVSTAPLSGQAAIYLGPEDVGERLVVVTAGPAAGRKRRKGATGSKSSRALVVVALLASFVAVAAAVVVVTRDGGRGGPNLDELREATVFISFDGVSGSGAIVSDDGLILTAAHVVAPDALGQGVLLGELGADLDRSPAEVEISVVRGDTIEPAFFGRVVASDGYLDLAVVRITETIGGTLVSPGDDLDLQTVELGDSQDLEQGDDLFVVGYPDITDSTQANVSEGTVGSFLPDRRLNNDNQAWINTDALGSFGSSGGLAADNDGRLVGTPAQVRSAEGIGASVVRVRPSHLARPLIEAAERQETYTSPFVREPGAAAKVTVVRPVEPAGNEGFSIGCEQSRATADLVGSTLAYSFDYEGFPTDAHQDLLVVLTDSSGDVVDLWTSADEYPFIFGTGAGCAVFTLGLDAPLSQGRYFLDFFVGGNYTQIVDGFVFSVT